MLDHQWSINKLCFVHKHVHNFYKWSARGIFWFRCKYNSKLGFNHVCLFVLFLIRMSTNAFCWLFYSVNVSHSTFLHWLHFHVFQFFLPVLLKSDSSILHFGILHSTYFCWLLFFLSAWYVCTSFYYQFHSLNRRVIWQCLWVKLMPLLSWSMIVGWIYGFILYAFMCVISKITFNWINYAKYHHTTAN